MIGEQPNMIKIEVTELDANLFAQFRRNQDLFQLLLDRGVFNIKNGKAILNFDHQGTLAEIKLSTITYKRSKENRL